MNTKELLNLDWVCINYIVEESPLASGEEYHANTLKFIPENYGTRQFRNVYYVYSEYEKAPFASIVCNPLSKILDKRLIQVKLENYLLYSDNAKKWLHIIRDTLHAKFLSISRVDICVDIVGFDFMNFITQYHDNKLREKHAKNVSEYYKKYNIDGKQESVYTGISWGSKKSEWTAKIYDKIREINEESGKMYIIDYLIANGINTDFEKVWRYEFSITSVKDKYLLEDTHTIDEIQLNDTNIFDFNVQKYILRYYLHLHAFAENTGKVRFIDEKRYHILNLLSQEVPPKRVRSSREKKKDYSAKVTINLGMQLLNYQTKCDAFITYKNILEIAKEYNLTEWLLKKYGKRLQEIYIEKSFIMYGVGIKELLPQDLFTTKERIRMHE